MLGVLMGSVCLAGLFFTLRRSRWSWRGRMRWLFQRLDTSPSQEKVLVQAADELTEAFAKLRDEWSATRAALARSLRGEALDTTPLRELDTRHDELVAHLRQTLRTSLSKVYEALDPRQRRELADLLEYGGRHGFRHRHGGWRCGSSR